MKKIKAYVVNHGHMDIEWYQPLTTYSEWFSKSIDMLDEIVKTENRLKQLEGQVNQTGDAMQDAGNKTDGFGDKLKSGLATTESGLLTVNIEAPDEDRRPFSRLVFSFPAFKMTGPDNELIEYLEWNFY